MINYGLQKTDAKIVTSKFFESNTQYVETDEVVTANMDVEVKTLGPKETYPNEKSEVQLYKCKSEEENLETMEVDKAVLSPKVCQNCLILLTVYRMFARAIT